MPHGGLTGEIMSVTISCMARKRTAGKSAPFQIRLHASLKTQLEKLAERKLTTMSAEIVEAVRKHLEGNGLWPPSKTT